MLDPYIAVALQTTVRHCAKRSEVEKNLTHIGNMLDLVCHICSLELPVRLIALGEGCIQGFADEILHLSSAEYTATMAADLPGWETEFLGNKAKQHGVFLLAQLKEKLPEYPDRFFNTVFLIDPAGKIIHKHRKNVVLFVEHSTTPHDVYDQWVKTHGDGLDAFFPVAKTEIGNIGGSVGVEGSFPESYRGFALNGAEILYRASLPEPWVSRGIWDVQNRARAVALSLVYPEDDSRLAGELLRLRELLPPEITLLAGGRALPAYRDALDKIGARQLNDLAHLCSTLDELRKPAKKPKR